MKQNEPIDTKGFFSCELFAKIKKYLHSADKDDPPVIGTTENFCEADPKVVLTKATITPATKDISMEEALSETHTPGAADLVTKLIEDESHDD